MRSISSSRGLDPGLTDEANSLISPRPRLEVMKIILCDKLRGLPIECVSTAPAVIYRARNEPD
jgi:hypothetical protein